jgi:lysophospholipase L1-like esterase
MSGAWGAEAGDVAAVARRRVFFGHQSVGANLLEGLVEVTGGAVRVVASRDPAAFDAPGVVHTLVGRNEAPLSKVEDFERAMASVGERPEVAFFKFCYVDFDGQTDVQAVFDAYRGALQRLAAKYPQVTFVAVTAPLTTVQSGPKAWLKHALGSVAGGERENAQRHAFNEKVREAFRGQPLFDLARLEARRPDGTTQSFTRDGARVPALVPEYSDDGGHLNAQGRKVMAEALVAFLAQLPAPAPAAPAAAPR